MNKIIKTEEKITNHLRLAWNLFIKLESTHPNHRSDFCDGINKCQQIIMWREMQRLNPKKYPTV